MAQRPVYQVDTQKYISIIDTEFKFYPGFALVQKQKNIASLHAAFKEHCPTARLLEISSKSPNPLGVKLSAFNLMVEGKSGASYSVEMVFQASKVFEKGGPFRDLLTKDSRAAKADPRLKNSGDLKGFMLNKQSYPLEPKTYFYNWLYINALARQPALVEELVGYDGFTDIEFNPKKSINCQAEAAAIFVALYRNGLLDKALASREDFLEIVYKQKASSMNDPKQVVQGSLFN